MIARGERGKSKYLVLGGLGGTALLIACCLLVPVAIGTAGVLAWGVEAGLFLFIAAIVALALRRRKVG